MHEKLAEIFNEHFTEHKKRTVSGVTLTYVSIDQILNRLNEMYKLGYLWDFENVTHDIYYVKDESTKSQYNDKTIGKTLGYVVVKGTLVIRQCDDNKIILTRTGVGSDKWLYYNKKYGTLVDDLDKGIKTAYAEAIKKAAYTTGISLYLWNEDERKAIEEGTDEDGKSNKLTDTQIAKVKKIKETFGIKVNNELDKYVVYWTKNNKEVAKKSKTYKDLNPENVDNFCKYISENGHEVIPFDG